MKPILQHYADYISNPKCDEWKNPLSLYTVFVTYTWTHEESNSTGVGFMRVKHTEHADEIIAYWNQVQDEWRYERTS